MDYANSLKALRSRLIEQSTGMADPAQSTSLESFIPSRMQSEMPQESTEDLMSKGANWISEIKKASLEFKEAYSELRSKSGQAKSPLAEAIKGAVSVAGKEQEEPEQTPEERRESFIRRRSEESPSSYAPTRPTEIKSFKDAIDLTEGGGGYDTLFGFSEKDGKPFEGVRISQMTIGEIKNFASTKGEYGQWVKGQVGRVATPMGRYQFVGTTLKNLAKEMGLSDDTVFSPEVQDQMFEYYLGKRISRGRTMSEKVSQVRGAWEGFKKIPTATLENLISQYEAA